MYIRENRVSIVNLVFGGYYCLGIGYIKNEFILKS